MNAPVLANIGPGRCEEAELEEVQLFLIGQFHVSPSRNLLKNRICL
jgi:hypothetical protein